MRISGTEPSSVILSQTKKFKILEVVQKSAKTIKHQKGWCNKPTILQFQWILKAEHFMLSKRYKSTEVDHRTWLHVSSGTPWSTSSVTHKEVEIQKRDFF